MQPRPRIMRSFLLLFHEYCCRPSRRGIVDTVRLKDRWRNTASSTVLYRAAQLLPRLTSVLLRRSERSSKINTLPCPRRSDLVTPATLSRLARWVGRLWNLWARIEFGRVSSVPRILSPSQPQPRDLFPEWGNLPECCTEAYLVLAQNPKFENPASSMPQPPPRPPILALLPAVELL
jgi:hypothetical protein